MSQKENLKYYIIWPFYWQKKNNNPLQLQAKTGQNLMTLKPR